MKFLGVELDEKTEKKLKEFFEKHCLPELIEVAKKPNPYGRFITLDLNRLIDTKFLDLLEQYEARKKDD